jgi:hypothetical protein
MFFVYKQNSSPIFSLSTYRFIHNDLLSDDYLSSIKIYATQLLDHRCDGRKLITQLKKEFTVLDKIEIAYRPCGIYIMMQAHKPLCCINEDHILTYDNQLVSKNYYSCHLFDALARVTVAENYVSKAASLVPSLLGALPSDFKHHYDLELINEHYLCLQSKQEKNFSVIASAIQSDLSCLLTQCALVKNKLAERKDFNEKINWIADTRFADYIIAYKT